MGCKWALTKEQTSQLQLSPFFLAIIHERNNRRNYFSLHTHVTYLPSLHTNEHKIQRNIYEWISYSVVLALKYEHMQQKFCHFIKPTILCKVHMIKRRKTTKRSKTCLCQILYSQYWRKTVTLLSPAVKRQSSFTPNYKYINEYIRCIPPQENSLYSYSTHFPFKYSCKPYQWNGLTGFIFLMIILSTNFL